MMQTLKDRSTRLQAFARLSDDGEGSAVAAAAGAGQQQTHEPDIRQEAPPAPAAISAMERQQLAEAARLPVPNLIRQSLGHQRGSSQPPLESHRRQHSHSPAVQPNGVAGKPGDASRFDLFNGSQLGDGFLVSGLTTPHSERADPEPEQRTPVPVPEPRPHSIPVPDRRNKMAHPRESSRGNFDRDIRPSNNASFQLGEDLLMKVVSGPRRHNPSHMNDGFHNGAVNGNGKSHENRQYVSDYGLRPASPSGGPPKLPLREVKIRNPHVERHNELNARNKRNQRPESPVFDTHNWQRRHPEESSRHARFPDADDDGASTTNGDARAFPRPSRANGSPVRRGANPAPAQGFQSQSPPDKKRRRSTLDYDDMALNNMSYADLLNEPFDFDPSKASPHHAGHGAGAGSLNAKLEQYRHQSTKEQRYLFQNLSVDDWEVAGDWFADQFVDIMQRLRDARRNKRQLMQDFEDEAAGREEAVRLRSEAIDRKLVKMRHDGQRVVGSHEG